LVGLDYSKRIGWDFINMKLDLGELLQKKIDLVSAKGLSKFIQSYVENEKALIYTR
jgi:uncharacterized protein